MKVQCAGEVEAVKQEVQHKQRQAARLLNAKAEEEAIKVSHTYMTECVYMALEAMDDQECSKLQRSTWVHCAMA